jgi:hypothetical protein
MDDNWDEKAWILRCARDAEGKWEAAMPFRVAGKSDFP